MPTTEALSIAQPATVTVPETVVPVAGISMWTDGITAAGGILFDLLDDLVNLIEGASVGRAPVAPLRAINAAQAAILVRPFVPDRHAVLVEIFDVGIAAQEPEQFVNDGFGMDFLGGEQREMAPQVKPRLRAEHGIRAGARAVGLELSALQNVPQQIEVLNHRGGNLTAKYMKYTKRNLVRDEEKVQTVIALFSTN